VATEIVHQTANPKLRAKIMETFIDIGKVGFKLVTKIAFRKIE
jgi:hypothetical protein